MIFKTITDDITGANKSIGLFGLSLKNISDKLYDVQTLGLKGAFSKTINTPTIDVKAIERYNTLLTQNSDVQKALAIASKNTNSATIALMKSANGITISTEQMTAAQKASTIAAKAQSAAYKAVSVAANMIAYALIAKGIQLASDAVDHYINRAKYAAEAMQEAQQKIDDSQSKLKEMSTALSENKDRFLELSQGVSKFSENLHLSEEDYAEYLSISNELAELFPSLVLGYDEQGNALLSIGNNADETNEKLQTLLETQHAVAQQTLIDNMDDVANGIYYEVEDAKNSIKEMESELDTLQQQYKEFNVDIASSNGAINFSDDDYSKYGKAMEDALTSAGIEFEKNTASGLYNTTLQLESASANQLTLAQKFYDAWLETENEYFHASENGLRQDIEQKEASIENSYSKMTANLQAWMKDNYNYQYLSDTASSLADALIPEIKWNELEESPTTAWDYQNYVEKNIINPLMEVPNEHKEEIDNMFQKLLSFEDGNLDVLKFATELQLRLKELGITIDITPIIADEQETKNRLQNSIESIAQGGSADFVTSSGISVDADDYSELQAYTKDFNEEQINLWNEVTLGAENATDAINKFEEALKNVDTDTPQTFTTTEVLSQIEALSEGLDQLDKIYADVYDKEEFDWSSILNNDGFKDQFGEMKNVTDEYKSAYDDFIKTISDNPDDLDACQEAFDNLATAYIYNSGALDNLTLETKDATIAMLQQMGVENAKQVVESQLALTTEEIKNAQAQLGIETANLTDLTIEQIEQLLNEGEISEYAKNQLYALYLTQIDLNANPIDTTNSINNLLKIVGASSKAGSALVELAKIMGEISKIQNFLATATGDTSLVEATLSGLENRAKLIKENATASFNTTTPAQVNYTGGSSTKSAKDKASKSDKETKETFDWIENKLESITKKTEKLAKAFEKAFTLSSTTKNFEKYLKQIEEEIKANQTAISTYQNKLNSIGLSSDWVKKIQEGNYSIEDVVNNDTLTAQINEYQTYYDKLLECQDKITDLEEERLEAQNTYAEKVIEFQEKEIEALERRIESKEAYISLKEAFGGSASEGNLSYMENRYSEQITLYDNQIDKLKELQKTVTKGSDAWNTYQEQIESNKQSVLDIAESIAELAKQIANLPLDKYEAYVEKNDSKSEYYSAKSENYASYQNKNKMLNEQIKLLKKNNNKAQSTADTTEKNVKTSISALSTANSADKKKATKDEKTKLSEYYKKVKTYTKSKKAIPTSLISDITNAGFGNLAKACSNYNAALTANETAQATADLMEQTTKSEIAALQKEKFDNISTIYENKQQHITDKANIINSKMNLASTKGYLGSQSWYNQLIAYEKKNKSSLTKELDALQKSLQEGLDNGSIKEYSSEWYDMVDSINATTQALEQSKITLQEYTNALRQVEFDNFDYKMEQFSRLISEADFYIDMLSNEELTKDGNLTEHGMVSLGLYAQNYDAYVKQAHYYADEIKRIQEMLADDPYNTELIAQLQEYEDAQRDALKATEQQKKAMVDLVKQGYEALSNSLSEIIAKYKEMLQSAKDANDYQKTISEKSETVDTLKKQISAYTKMSGNDEIASKLQKANKELKEAEKDIQETMYEKYISDTQDALDDMLNELETFISELDFEGIFEDAMEIVNDNTGDIKETLYEMSSEYGTSISSALSSIWANGYTPEKGFSSVVSAIDRLIAVSDKQADKVAYNEATANITDTSSYEKAVKTASNKVKKLEEKKDNASTLLKNSLDNLHDSQREKGTLEAQYQITETLMAEARHNMDKALNYGKNTPEYKDAEKIYNMYVQELEDIQARIKQTEQDIYQNQQRVAQAQDNYNSVSSDLKNAKTEKKNAEDALSNVMASNKSVISTFLKAIVNYDEEVPNDALSKKIGEITDGGVIESHNKSQLATLLGCSSSDSDLLDGLKKYGFKKGSRSVPYDQLNWTQEGGGEIILRKSDGAMLTPLGAGDKVFTAEMSERLWELAKMNPVQFKGVDIAPVLPVFEKNIGGGDVNISLGDLYLPDVTDASQFADSLADALKNNSKIQKILDTKVSSSMLGKNSLSVRKF